MLLDVRLITALIACACALILASAISRGPELIDAAGSQRHASVDGREAGSTFASVAMPALTDANSKRLENDVEREVRSFIETGVAATRASSLMGLRSDPDSLALRSAVEGIPPRELRITAFVAEPERPLEPWRVEAYVGVRDVKSAEPDFATPSTRLLLELRPWGRPSAELVERWTVTDVAFRPGGLLTLARRVTYQRFGDVAVLAPARDVALAREVGAVASDVDRSLRRRYAGLWRTRGVFIALVPDERSARRVFEPHVDLRDASGVALDDRHIAILLPDLRGMDALDRRDVIRHEMTHIATDELTAIHWYGAIVEGVAEWEGKSEIVRSGEHYLHLGVAVDAVRSGDVDLKAFLMDGEVFYETDTEIAYSLALLVVDYIEHEFGHAKALRFYSRIARGEDMYFAVRSVFDQSGKEFVDGVRSWVLAHPTWDNRSLVR